MRWIVVLRPLLGGGCDGGGGTVAEEGQVTADSDGDGYT